MTAPEPKTIWTIGDFDDLSWHDNHIHALRIVEGEDGTGELILDIDHIVEWIPLPEKEVRFRVAPATLTFHEVSDLRVEVDFAATSACLVPMAIGVIERETVVYSTEYRSFRWRILLDWPPGKLSFVSLGFTQVLREVPIVTEEQSLKPAQRGTSGI